MKVALLLIGIAGAFAYIPNAKDALVSGLLLRDFVGHMSNDMPDMSYIDFPESRMLGARSLEEAHLYPAEYDALGEGGIHPSLRDQEFLEHSSLWGSQAVSGGAGEGGQRLRPAGSLGNVQEVKTDAALPAYCNPPNPCPVGYVGEMGCIEEFENTATFSRRYQAAQDCMCDTEHMFDCLSTKESAMEEDPIDTLNELEFGRFLQRTLQLGSGGAPKSLAAKEFQRRGRGRGNPFLDGERLPVAAKKGNNVQYY